MLSIKTIKLKIWVLGLGLGTAQTALAAPVFVAVAANFTAPFKEISAQFSKETGYTISSSFGATGALYAQIKHGAPYQILLAADHITPQKLIVEKLALASSQLTYAQGHLVLWSADPRMLDKTAKVLYQNNFDHIAIANPNTSPYGAAAVQTLQKLGLYQQLKPKLVTGESISQTYQFAATGNSELAFVALSQLYTQGKYTASAAWIVPPHLYRPIKQNAVLLLPGQNNPTAQAFLNYLKGEYAQKVIKAYGYSIPTTLSNSHRK